MRNLIILFFVFVTSNLIFSQNEDRSGGKSYGLKVQLGTGVFNGAQESYDLKIQGSPYLSKDFKAANVSQINVIANMRYNVYKDEFEFITPKNDTLILDKINDFANLEFVNSKTKYFLTNYTNESNRIVFGYLINLYEKGNFGLFKKDNILMQEEKIAKTTLEANMPAKYYNASSTYFLKNDKNFIKFPESKKQLVKIFPDKKEMIEKFLKENKIDFDITEEKIKIIDFLTTL